MEPPSPEVPRTWRARWRAALAALRGGGADRAHLEAELERARESTESFRRRLENAQDVIAEWSGDGRPLWISPSVERMLGITPEEFLLDPAGLLHPEDRDETLAALARRIREGGSGTLRFRLRDCYGGWHWVDSTSNVHRTRSGEVRVVTVSRDVTDRRRIEDQVRQAQKMEATGRLAGGIAHDLNNLLTIITGSSAQLREALPVESPLRHSADEIESAVRRAADLIRQLLAYGRRQVMKAELLSLNDVVEGMEPMIRRLLGEDVDVDLRLDPDLGSARCDRGQLEQVVLNLVLNARDAMLERGRIRFETRNVRLRDGDVAPGEGLRPGPYVALRVVDDGVGMAPELLSHVFEPFFTTKEPGEGTGLGLAMVYGIVRQSGGHVTAESARGAGTTISLYLPQVEESEARGAVEPERRAEAARGGDETVLVVEDEPGVRRILTGILDRAGYRVLDASCGDEALAVASRETGTIHLLVTDLVMPGLSGAELAEKLCAERPGLRLLFVTGYADHSVLESPLIEPHRNLLRKPFSLEELTAAVRRVLDEH